MDIETPSNRRSRRRRSVVDNIADEEIMKEIKTPKRKDTTKSEINSKGKSLLKRQDNFDLTEEYGESRKENIEVLETSSSKFVATTPRRSGRKSIRPIHDYDDIILKSTSKKKTIGTIMEIDDAEINQNPVKWTPSSVGRSSEKRSRKNKRILSEKKKFIDMEVKETECPNITEEKDTKIAKSIEVVVEGGTAAPSTEEILIKDETIGVCEKPSSSEINIGAPLTESDVYGINGPLAVTFGGNEIQKIEVVDESFVAKKIKEEEEVQKEEGEQSLTVADEKTQTLNCSTMNKFDSLGNSQPSSPVSDEHFGTYLKSNQIDISDLGLQPLDNGLIDDMPSLLILDDSDDSDNHSVKDEKVKLNETFDASDSIIVLEDKRRASTPTKSIKMEDDKDTLKNVEPLIEEHQPKENLSATKKQVRINPSQVTGTPAKPSKAFRFPTPHKSKINFRFSNSGTENDCNEARLSTSLPMENKNDSNFPTEGVRRRSASFTLNFPEEKARKNVYFYSPANQTTIIEDFDVLIAQKQKQEVPKQSSAVKSKTQNVTLRRKRSLSLDDISKMSNPKPEILVKESLAQKQVAKKSSKLRTKLPNFAALHQKHFEKMENLEEYLERKAERAKIMSNSASKFPTSSTKKSELRNATKRAADEKPKALKKINLVSSSQTPVKKQADKIVENKAFAVVKPRQNENKNDDNLPNPLDFINKNKSLEVLKKDWKSGTKRQATDGNPKVLSKTDIFQASAKKQDRTLVKSKIPGLIEPSQKENVNENNAKNLPNPLDFVNKNNFEITKQSGTSIAPKSIQKEKKTNVFEINKPVFNLSTSVASTSRLNAVASKLNSTTIGTRENRLQRHMNMFKARSVRNANTGDITTRQNEIIRGVRSNRRFELQMQHRRNLDI